MFEDGVCPCDTSHTIHLLEMITSVSQECMSHGATVSMPHSIPMTPYGMERTVSPAAYVAHYIIFCILSSNCQHYWWHWLRGESLGMRLHVHISKADNHRDFQRYYMYTCTVHVHVQSVIGTRQCKATTSEDGSFFQRKNELPQAVLELATSYVHTMQMLYQVSHRGSSAGQAKCVHIYRCTCVLVRCS